MKDWRMSYTTASAHTEDGGVREFVQQETENPQLLDSFEMETTPTTVLETTR